MRQAKWIGSLLGLIVGLPITGCFTGGVYQVPENESLTADLTAETTPRVARSQQQDPADQKNRPQLAPPQASPPPPYIPGDNNGIQQTNLERRVRVNVRAWVNGKPMFDDEVMQALSPATIQQASSLPEPTRSERLAEVYNQTLENMIDQEVAFQDAVHKLEIGNKDAFQHLKQIVGVDYEKQLKKMRESGRITEAQIKEFEHNLRRQMERNIISGEYLRSRIFPIATAQANPLAIKEYYEKHINEFQRPDSVKWLDVFIAVGPKYPTVADAKRFAEDLVSKCRTEADFAKLLPFDDGDSKYRNGEGMGSRRGEIKPPELEETLFRMKVGDMAQVIPISTGVHILRLTQRENAGLIPLDEKTQKQIENKIKNQVFENEYKRIIRELRNRSTIVIERE